jgi:D-tyrosyl-tRNA(Tyr) deacylase
MRAVIQRVARACVDVDGITRGQIGRGLLVLVAVAPTDGMEQVRWLADKVVNLRIFPDEDGRMNLSVRDVDGGVLAVSQFTLYGDVRKGRRPSFVGAAVPDVAEPLVDAFLQALRDAEVKVVASGVFGADMKVDLLNDGPVTLVVDTP